MKLVILGAGASFDAFTWYSNPELFQNWRAPLANELFSDRPEFRRIFLEFPGPASLFNEIATITDIEDFFQKKYDRARQYKSSTIEKQLINTRYFLQKLFFEISARLQGAGPSNYHKLVTVIDEYILRTKEDVLVVNFNYDLLFERELKYFYTGDQTTFDIMESLNYPIKMVKPHGSCNWFTPFVSNGVVVQNKSISQHLMQEGYSMEEINNLLMRDKWFSTHYTTNAINDTVHGPLNLFPQIHIPLKTKDEFTMPKWQIDYLLGYLPKVDGILIVGWKGNEAHFNSVLEEHLKTTSIKIEVVNGPKTDNYDPVEVLTNMSDYINVEDNHIFNKEYPADLLSNLNKNTKAFLSEHCTAGGFSSYLLCLQKETHKSIFS